MSNSNQIRPSNQGAGKWYCTPCKKQFDNDSAIHEHCRDVAFHAAEWCDRCNWLFAASSGLQEHISYSTIHWVCLVEGCSNDFKDTQSRDRHQEFDHGVCIRCWDRFENDGQPDRPALVRHQIDKHFMCDSCGKYLENNSSRIQHKKIHNFRSKQCFGCARKFTSYSAMMIHLEAGTCDRPYNISDIDRWTTQCHPHRDTTTPYSCATCRYEGDPAAFGSLSGLLQHQESQACQTDGYSPMVQKLLKFIAVRIRIAPYPAGQALTVLAKMYVDNTGSFQEQLGIIEEALPIMSLQGKKDGRVRTVSCLLPTGSTPWTH